MGIRKNYLCSYVAPNVMAISAPGVGLPHFNQRIFQRAAEAIAHVAMNDDAFANRQTVFGVVEDQVVIQRAEILLGEDRAGDF